MDARGDDVAELELDEDTHQPTSPAPAGLKRNHGPTSEALLPPPKRRTSAALSATGASCASMAIAAPAQWPPGNKAMLPLQQAMPPAPEAASVRLALGSQAPPPAQQTTQPGRADPTGDTAATTASQASGRHACGAPICAAPHKMGPPPSQQTTHTAGGAIAATASQDSSWRPYGADAFAGPCIPGPSGLQQATQPMPAGTEAGAFAATSGQHGSVGLDASSALRIPGPAGLLQAALAAGLPATQLGALRLGGSTVRYVSSVKLFFGLRTNCGTSDFDGRRPGRPYCMCDAAF